MSIVNDPIQSISKKKLQVDVEIFDNQHDLLHRNLYKFCDVGRVIFQNLEKKSFKLKLLLIQIQSGLQSTLGREPDLVIAYWDYWTNY